MSGWKHCGLVELPSKFTLRDDQTFPVIKYQTLNLWFFCGETLVFKSLTATNDPFEQIWRQISIPSTCRPSFGMQCFEIIGVIGAHCMNNMPSLKETPSC